METIPGATCGGPYARNVRSEMDPFTTRASGNADERRRLSRRQVKSTLIGLSRDLRGIALATNSRRTYGLLFDWIYPSHMPLLLRAVEIWADTPQVTTDLVFVISFFTPLKKFQIGP